MIFDPLEMNDTGDIFFGDISDRMVKLYVKKRGWFSWKTGLPSLMKKHLSGDEHEAGWRRLFSTVDDYSKLMQLLSCGGSCKGRQLIGSQTIDLMRANSLTPQQQIDFEDAYNAGYGYGCGVRTVIAPERGKYEQLHWCLRLDRCFWHLVRGRSIRKSFQSYICTI